MIITVFVYIKKVSHLPSQIGIFVFTFTVKRFHIYGALLHLALNFFTFTRPYYIFTFRGATYVYAIVCTCIDIKRSSVCDMHAPYWKIMTSMHARGNILATDMLTVKLDLS